MQRIILAISAITGESIQPGKTLIILDEIQELRHGLASLKYFCEDANQYHVAVAGSLLGIMLHEGESYYNETKNLLVDKYYGFTNTSTHEGYESWHLFLPRYSDDEEMIWYRCYGEIDLYISKFTDTYPIRYTLHVHYIDQINNDKNDNDKQNDL